MVPGHHKKQAPKPDDPNLSTRGENSERSLQLEQETKVDYKTRLDEATKKDRMPAEEKGGALGAYVTPMIEKVSQYVPAIGKTLGEQSDEAEKQQQPSTSSHEESSEPRRPDHDTQIECFIRDQHRSLRDGKLE